MEEYLKYNLQKVKNKKNIGKRKNKLSYKNNIIQFSLNAINNILINNLNSSTTLGMLNITNNLIAKNKNQTTNTNSYINSINDCLDYKIKGNIYKPSESFFFDLYPKIDNIVKTKKRQKKELKILKFDKEILVSQAKTPTKKISKQFCFDIIDKNNNKNIYYRHSRINTSISPNNISPNNILNEYRTKKINNSRNYCVYRTSTTINSKEKNYSQQNSSNNSNSNRNSHVNSNTNRNTYVKKIRADKNYIINRTNVNSRENSIEKKKLNIDIKNINNQKMKIHNLNNNKLIYKTIDTNNIPKKMIIYNKNKIKEKTQITNSLKNKTKNNNSNNNKTDLHINKKNCKTNTLLCNNNNNNNKHIIKNYDNNISMNTKNSPKTERNTYFNNNNKYVLYLNNNKINRNELLLTPNKKIINKSKNKNNNSNKTNNRNLNIQYNPTISNNININLKKEKESPKNSSHNKKSNKNLHNLKDKNLNVNKKYDMNNYHTINNDKIIHNPNIYFTKKLKSINNKKNKNEMLSQTQTYNVNNNEMKNDVFDSGESSIFKILDNTQVITPDDCTSSTKSNKIDNFNGSNSNGTEANQETDYNSLKTFNNNFAMNEYMDNYNLYNLNNNNNCQSIGNFSFNNL